MRVRSGRLEAALSRFAARRRVADRLLDAGAPAMSAGAFRSSVTERLRALERDVAEVRARVNGLLFVVAGAAVTQIVLKLVG